MSSLNKIFLMGNLTRDPELRYTPSNVGVASFGLAVNSNIGKGSDGNKKVETLFIDVTSFGKQAEVIAQYCKKGMPLFIEGRLRFSTWEDKDGNKRTKHEVILSGLQFIGAKKESGNGDASIPDDEDIPF